jgi:DNA-directed RNA polymerase subunit RPC12/RpoP
VKCIRCGSEDIVDSVVASISGIECEIKYTCSKCGEEVAYWAYGAFDPQYQNIKQRTDDGHK